MPNTLEIKDILDNLNSMEKELGRMQEMMNKSLAIRIALLQKITELATTKEEIVFEKTERIKLRRTKK